MIEYKDKTAIITGAASGIGKAIAEECIRKKMKIVIIDINQENLIELKNRLGTRDIVAIKADVTNEQDMDKIIDQTISNFGKIHFLFNNAGIAGPLGPLWKINLTEYKYLMDCNFTAMLVMIQKIIPIMLKQGDPCFIINTGSGAGFGVEPNSCAYHVSKHAVVAMTETLYLELKKIKANIQIFLFIPSATKTGFSDVISYQESKQINIMIDKFKDFLKTHGKSPAEVVKILFEGIENKQFYIFTDFDKQKIKIKKRINRILLGKNPGLV